MPSVCLCDSIVRCAIQLGFGYATPCTLCYEYVEDIGGEGGKFPKYAGTFADFSSADVDQNVLISTFWYESVQELIPLIHFENCLILTIKISNKSYKPIIICRKRNDCTVVTALSTISVLIDFYLFTIANQIPSTCTVSRDFAGCRATVECMLCDACLQNCLFIGRPEYTSIVPCA